MSDLEQKNNESSVFVDSIEQKLNAIKLAIADENISGVEWLAENIHTLAAQLDIAINGEFEDDKPLSKTNEKETVKLPVLAPVIDDKSHNQLKAEMLAGKYESYNGQPVESIKYCSGLLPLADALHLAYSHLNYPWVRIEFNGKTYYKSEWPSLQHIADTDKNRHVVANSSGDTDKTMNHLMVDIETMGTLSTAPIISIGACYFNPSTGDIGHTFYVPISLVDTVLHGAIIEAGTVLWWMQQNQEAQAKFKDNDKHELLSSALVALRKFMDRKGVQVWGNGASFDNVLLRSAYDSVHIGHPWQFYNERDVRTMVMLGRQLGFDPKKDMPFDGVAHDALADAIHQAKYTSAIYQRLLHKS